MPLNYCHVTVCDAGIALCLWVHLSLRSLWSPHSALAIRQFAYVRYLQSVPSSMIFLVLVFFAVAKGKRSQEATHDLLAVL